MRGSWPPPEWPRDCGHIDEGVPYIFQFSKGEKTWYNLNKVLSRWRERNKADPNITPEIIHGITLCRKGKPLQPPPSLPILVDNVFKKQTDLGWLQALMGLIYQNWAEVQNAYLGSLGAKISGVIWISALITKLWNRSWDIWSFRNHIIHATDGPKKKKILALINRRVSLYFNIWIS